MSDERKKGWGSLVNTRNAHYFNEDGRSLCNRWLAFGAPRWESNQELGDKPTNGTCKTCWKKRAKQEAMTPATAQRG